MENYIFLYVQSDVEKAMVVRLPIGTQVSVDTWQDLFKGFNATLLRVCSFRELLGGVR